jgi:YrbI family 3-deoxy-D-manno-octulosonate 8-phosphate phosphatase
VARRRGSAAPSAPAGRVVALVPLRGGSKSIPRKNLRRIAGRPLCAWAIAAALRAPGIAEVWVSTDDPEIAEAATAVDARVGVVDRPASLARDTSSTESVMLHFAREVPFDWLVTLQATSPLTTPEDLARGLDLVARRRLDSLLTATRVRRFFWDDDDRPVNYDPRRRPRRQDFPGTRMENGAFYVTSRRVLSRDRCRLGGRIGVLEMAGDTAVELDEPDDWAVVERLLLRRSPVGARLREARALVLDVDGVLTDGAMYYGPEGEALKRFHTRDGHGLVRLRAAGLRLALLTREATPFAAARARKLGIEDVLSGVQDKAQGIAELARRWDLAPETFVYMGDDDVDLPALRAVGVPAAPADAAPPALGAAAYVTRARGGEGAVRELCDAILAARGSA